MNEVFFSEEEFQDIAIKFGAQVYTVKLAWGIIVDIMNDIDNRAGIGGEFRSIDEDVMKEMYTTWIGIVLTYM